MICIGSLFDDLKQGLQEAIDIEKGHGKTKSKQCGRTYLSNQNLGLLDILASDDLDETDYVVDKK